jgi:hypothetical protein
MLRADGPFHVRSVSRFIVCLSVVWRAIKAGDHQFLGLLVVRKAQLMRQPRMRVSSRRV